MACHLFAQSAEPELWLCVLVAVMSTPIACFFTKPVALPPGTFATASSSQATSLLLHLHNLQC